MELKLGIVAKSKIFQARIRNYLLITVNARYKNEFAS